MNDLKVMVVGAGALGRHHARILAGLNGVSLSVVADPRENTGRAVAEQHGARWVPDYRTALDRIDAASVVVPTSLHVPVSIELLNHGIPVLVEKPLAASIGDAERLTRLAADQGCVLQVGHVERFNPAYRAAKQRIGNPQLIRTERYSPFPFRSMDIGVVHDLLIHDIDLVLDLVQSEVVDVQSYGVCAMSGFEDMVNARLTFASGCVADLTANRINPSACRRMQIWSDSGRVDVDFQSREIHGFSPSEELQSGPSPVELAQQRDADIDQLKRDVFGRFITREEPEVSDADALTAELSEFVQCVRSGGQPSCSGAEASDALRVADQVLNGMVRCNWRGTQPRQSRAA